METVRIVEPRKPLFGDEWPNPPSEPATVRRVEGRSPVQEAADHRLHALDEVIRLGEETVTFLEGLLAWLGESPWTSDLAAARKTLDRVLDHYYTARSGDLG